MRNRLRLFSALVAVAALLATQAQAAQAQVNMTGTWAMVVDVDGAISNPGLVLVQSGMSLTGHYTSAQLGEADVMGTVDGNTVVVTFEADVGGQVAPVEYRGAVDANGVWSGTFDLAGGLAGGSFTATKASE